MAFLPFLEKWQKQPAQLRHPRGTDLACTNNLQMESVICDRVKIADRLTECLSLQLVQRVHEIWLCLNILPILFNCFLCTPTLFDCKRVRPLAIRQPHGGLLTGTRRVGVHNYTYLHPPMVIFLPMYTSHPCTISPFDLLNRTTLHDSPVIWGSWRSSFFLLFFSSMFVPCCFLFLCSINSLLWVFADEIETKWSECFEKLPWELYPVSHGWCVPRDVIIFQNGSVHESFFGREKIRRSFQRRRERLLFAWKFLLILLKFSFQMALEKENGLIRQLPEEWVKLLRSMRPEAPAPTPKVCLSEKKQKFQVVYLGSTDFNQILMY